MKRLPIALRVLLGVSGALTATFEAAYPQPSQPSQPPSGSLENLPPADAEPTEARAAFDGVTNGFLTEEELKAAQTALEDREEVDRGLGPVYNAQSCVECHQNPLAGGISQITELRDGHRVFSDGQWGFRGEVRFEAAPGGS